MQNSSNFSHPIKIILVGCGQWMKKKYLPLLKKQDLNVVGWVNVLDSQTQNELKDLFPNGNFYQRIEDISNISEAKGAIVSLPHALYFENIKQLFIQGWNVLADKPASISSKELSKLIKLAKINNLTFATAHQRRSYTGFQQLHDIITTEKIGKLRWLNGQMLISSYPDWTKGWRNNPKLSGEKNINQGILLDAGSHLIDTILFLNDYKLPTSVYCHLEKRHYNVDSDAQFMLKFDNNVCVSGIISRDVPTSMERESIRVLGDKGAGECVIRFNHLEQKKQAWWRYSLLENSDFEEFFDPNEHTNQPLGDFIKFLRTGKMNQLWLSEKGVVTLSVIDALYKSALSNKPMKPHIPSYE